LTKTGSEHPFVGPNLAYGISEKVTKRTIRDGMNRKHQEPQEFIRGQKCSKELPSGATGTE
jgi:hypothetical protein